LLSAPLSRALFNSLRHLAGLCLAWVLTTPLLAAPSVALYYGARPPLDELKAFDIVVVEPDHGITPKQFAHSYSSLYAYVGIGEAQPSRPWFKDLPDGIKLTQNAAWGSAVVDLSHPAWADFVAERIVAPLWASGYRGFFLDTLDSYRLAKNFDEAAQQRGLIKVIETLHRRFPGIRLILNRGFEVVPAVRDKIAMVAAESLFQGWDAGNQRYVEVPASDREWLLGQLRKVRDEHRLPVLAIDYVTPGDRALARATAERIKALGIVPWVADGLLDSLGVGAVEVVPRKVLVLYDRKEASTLNEVRAHRFIEMPLNHLGYTAEYHDLQQPLPSGHLAGRVAGIVVWPAGNIPRSRAFMEWLRQQIDAGIKVAFLGDLGIPLDRAGERLLGLAQDDTTGNATISRHHPMFGFEAPLRADKRMQGGLRLTGSGKPLVELSVGGKPMVGAALTPWGGFALDPFLLRDIPGSEQYRWLVDPFAFLQEALALPPLPVPDVSTENGRRLLMAHIDGDGFPSLAELPGSPLSGRVLLDEILKRYRIPHAMSVIEAEVAPHGLYPKLASEMEGIARQMFALPHVEIASHTFSHPFLWDMGKIARKGSKEEGAEAYHLAVPGYQMNLQREIVGSIEYIRQRLAPAGKPVQILLWSGDTEPGADALAIAEQAGLLNMNGGNTLITQSFPSLTAVGPFGIVKDGYAQVYAPVINENVYTNLWTGPFYGYRRVLETFALTEKPRRLKPVAIYYHTYSASKRASLEALHQIYGWAAGQPLHPVFPSEYIRKVRDFSRAVLARDGNTWIYRGNGDLRTLRAPAALGTPDPANSSALAGYQQASEGHYLHLAGEQARIRFASHPGNAPFMREANGRLESWQAAEGQLRFRLKAHQPLIFALGNARNCDISADGRRLPAGESSLFKLDHAAATIQVSCPRR